MRNRGRVCRTEAKDWIHALAERTGMRCVWLGGHSEGGLVALAAVADKPFATYTDPTLPLEPPFVQPS